MSLTSLHLDQSLQTSSSVLVSDLAIVSFLRLVLSLFVQAFERKGLIFVVTLRASRWYRCIVASLG